MDVLSATTKIRFQHTDAFGWQELDTEHEYYLIQPAVRYWHLKEAVKLIHQSPYYKKLNVSQRNTMQKQLEQQVFGEMMEQILLFDTKNELDREDYEIFKPVFEDGDKKKAENTIGEYDMLVYDKKQMRHWDFEVKHTFHALKRDCRHLVKKEVADGIEYFYGPRAAACVLYRGPSVQMENGIFWLNAVEFAAAVHETRDVAAAMGRLTKDLPQKSFPDTGRTGSRHAGDSTEKDSDTGDYDDI
jgi:hypothetical protein